MILEELDLRLLLESFLDLTFFWGDRKRVNDFKLKEERLR